MSMAASLTSTAELVSSDMPVLDTGRSLDTSSAVEHGQGRGQALQRLHGGGSSSRHSIPS